MFRKITLSKITNTLLILFVFFIFAQRGPQLLAMFKSQGQIAPTTELTLLDHHKIQIPLNRKHLVVFWATWCGPCKVELSRINRLIQSGSLSGQDVIAISSSEDVPTVRQFIQDHDSKFTVAVDPYGAVAKLYKISGTPTLLLIDESGVINWMTMGLSPSLELRLMDFFSTNSK